jgi:hypothetical protein
MTWDNAFPLAELKCTNKSGDTRHFELRVQVINEPNNALGLDCFIKPIPPFDVG